MDWIYLGMVIFLFILAAFDLWVGVSNDAVNFLNSAIGSRAAKFRTLTLIAGIGVFCGCVLSNGMMDIARHGIFMPQYFSFKDVMYIYMAVMVTDIVLLDMFNSLGMPTSTTVSMVFELLGAAFAFTLFKTSGDGAALAMSDYLNTSKALEVIIAIFLSVPIAFIFGSLMQYITRIVFTFDLKKNLRFKIGIFGGLAITAILYFMLFKGLKDLSFMSPEVKAYINGNIWKILGCIFVAATVVMQFLHECGVNVFRVIVLIGTFSLATAFAGNDLVNFIGVPLAGFSSYNDFMANGGALAPDEFMMTSLQDSAKTPFVFLAASGAIMVMALATSKKARHVTETEVGLSSKNEGDEMFGSSRVARSLVRLGRNLGHMMVSITPQKVSQFINSRFQVPEQARENEAAYDMCRAANNLVVASLLIALGTSLKLPLSTTFVTFMVAMGSSLADRAWSRESAVFRITGVLTVIGGWFITAGIAFAACFVVALLMKFGSMVAVFMIVAAAILCIIHSQKQYNKKRSEVSKGDTLFQEMISVQDRTSIIPMLSLHMDLSIADTLDKYSEALRQMTDGLFSFHLRPIHHAQHDLSLSKRDLKNLRRRETICLRRAQPPIAAMRLCTNFHLIHNSLRQLLYGLIRIAEPASEHVDNNFTPIDPLYAQQYCSIRNKVLILMDDISDDYRSGLKGDCSAILTQCTVLDQQLFSFTQQIGEAIQDEQFNLNAMSLMLHITQETRQIVVELRSLVTTTGAYLIQATA